MIIAVLDFGSAAICNTDYLEVYDALFNGGGQEATSRRLITRYCGNVRHVFSALFFRTKSVLQDNPSEIRGQSNGLIVKYVTSRNNTGSWRALFQFAESGNKRNLLCCYYVHNVSHFRLSTLLSNLKLPKIRLKRFPCAREQQSCNSLWPSWFVLTTCFEMPFCSSKTDMYIYNLFACLSD